MESGCQGSVLHPGTSYVLCSCQRPPVIPVLHDLIPSVNCDMFIRYLFLALFLSGRVQIFVRSSLILEILGHCALKLPQKSLSYGCFPDIVSVPL